MVDRNNHYIKIKVEFGPRFYKKGPLTNGTLIKHLRKKALNHKNSFIGPMFNHIADHLELNAKESGSSKNYLAAQSSNTFATCYYGCKSCVTDGADGSLCQDNNGNWSCDRC